MEDFKERIDIIQAKRISGLCNLSSLTFSSLMFGLVQFTKSLLIDESALLALGVTRDAIEAANRLIQLAEQYFCNSSSVLDLENLENGRVAAWDLYDSEGNGTANRHLFRIVVCCLYDEEAAEFDAFGAESIVDTFLSCLADLSSLYCERFGDYAVAQWHTN